MGGGGGDFFFSSRRRHTGLRRDWSSDVCYSDLGLPGRQRRLFERKHDLSVEHPLKILQPRISCRLCFTTPRPALNSRPASRSPVTTTCATRTRSKKRRRVSRSLLRTQGTDWQGSKLAPDSTRQRLVLPVATQIGRAPCRERV